MSAHKPVLFCLGANHRTADADLREQLYIPRDELALLMSTFQERYGFSELVILSTCNRFEIMGVAEPGAIEEHKLFDCFWQLQLASKVIPKIEVNKLHELTYLYSGLDAIKHLFEVTASLDSLVVGETQITGQVKAAFDLASDMETLGPILQRCLQEALASAKAVRSQTDIGKKTVSISHAAIELAHLVFGSLAKHEVVVIGAGDMARVACEHLQKHKPSELYIVNRTLTRASQLQQELGAGTACELGELPKLLTSADVVFSATGADHPVVTHDMLKSVWKNRKSKPLFFIDIALPRDIDPKCADLDDVFVFDIDDLKQVVDRNQEQRLKEAERGFEIISAAVEKFSIWLETLSVKPTLAKFTAYCRGLVHQELQRSLGRGVLQKLDAEQRDALQKMVEAIAKRLVADAGASLREPPEGVYRNNLADALEVMFGNVVIESESGDRVTKG